MKKSVLALCLAFCSLLLWGCAGDTYPYTQELEQVSKIELLQVTAYDGTISVEKELSSEEYADFLAELSEIRFFTYYLSSEGAKTQGYAVRIYYQNGDWDLINGYLCHQEKDGVEFVVNRNCDQDALQKLVEKYL